MEYTVIGTCAVAGVQPGGTVKHADLVARKANIEALLGSHLKPVAVKRAPKKGVAE